MIRILHIVSSLSKNAGIISMLMNYFRNIDRSQLIFDFVYFKDSDDDHYYMQEISELGGRCYRIQKLSLTNINIVNQEIERIFDEYEYATVHCHEAILVNFIQKELRKCGVKRLIIHSHSASLSNTKLGLIRNRMMTLGMKKHCDDIVACSMMAGEYLFGKKEFNKRGKVIINGVDPLRYTFDIELREQTRKKYNIPDEAFVLGTVGRCEAIKNQSFVFDLLSDKRIKNHEIRFLLVGAGPLFEDLKKQVLKRRLDQKVIFLGSQDDIRPFLCAMDMFLFPSKKEGFGIALVEAQLCKLSCIANDTIPKETKISDFAQYISIEEPDRWVQAIGKAFYDKDIRDNREYDSTYVDIKQCTKKLEEFYFHR